MIRSFVGAVLLAGCAFTALAESATAADERSLPMAFALRREGPADVCGAKCRSWISAVGAITSDTPRQFECTRLITPEQVKAVIRTIPGFGAARPQQSASDAGGKDAPAADDRKSSRRR